MHDTRQTGEGGERSEPYSLMAMTGYAAAGSAVDDRYRLLEVIEEGGLGVVWRGVDPAEGLDVAVKMLRFPEVLDRTQQEALRGRVAREARQVAGIDHPGLVKVYEVADIGGRPWVITELVEAPSLAQMVAANGPVAPEVAASIGLEVLDALTTAHSHGVVHRFLHPSKVLVPLGGPARVADFGVASLIGDPTVAATGAVGDSIAYMAPEQAGTPAADLWSLGATLYFAVEGVPPFEADGERTIVDAITDDPPRPTRFAGPLAPVLDAMLAKDPDDRPEATELRTRLEQAAAREPEVVAETLIGPAGATVAGPEVEADADTEPPPADAQPAPPVPTGPGVALSRMFARDPGTPPPPLTYDGDGTDAVPGDPWPVAHSRGLLTLGLCAFVTLVLVLIMVANGRQFGRARPAKPKTVAVSKIRWETYTDPTTGFRIDHPATWTVTHQGNFTDFRDPNAAAALRIVARASSGATAEDSWLALERTFAQEHDTYQRMRIEATPYRSLDAALWEFTYSQNKLDFHNLDLGVVVPGFSYALNFEARSEVWKQVRPLYDRFASSFQVPAQPTR
jgi:hypothetical protein